MRTGEKERKCCYGGKGREEKKNKKKKIIIFVSLALLMYFSPWVISSIWKYWFRIRHGGAGCRKLCCESRISRAVRAQRRSGDWVCSGNYVWPKQGQAPPPSARTRLGWHNRSSPRDGPDGGVLGYIAWGWGALKDEGTSGVKWSKMRKKGLVNAKISFLPTLLAQTEGSRPTLSSDYLL